MNFEDYVTIKDAADALGVSKQTIRNWTKSGYLKCWTHPISRYRFYLKTDIQDLKKDIEACNDYTN